MAAALGVNHSTLYNYVSSREELISLMIDDIYGIGVVLQEKYRLLRIAYAAFMIALVLGVTSFVIVFGYAAFFDANPAVFAPGAPVGPTVIPYGP